MPKNDGKTLQQRFDSRYKIDYLTGCWNWTAGTNGKGYAYIWTGPRKNDMAQAYKVGWVLKYGPVPDGLELHHKCENPLCVNPDHLEPLTHKQHQRKHPNVITTRLANQTKCKRGHSFTPENTRIKNSGSRLCITCSREQAKLYQRKQRAM